MFLVVLNFVFELMVVKVIDDDLVGFDFGWIKIIFCGSERVYLVIFKCFVDWFSCFNF